MRALPRKVTHFHIWHLHSIFIQSTIEPGGPVQFGWIRYAYLNHRFFRTPASQVAASSVFYLQCCIFFSSVPMRISFSLFSFSRRASEFGIRTKWYVYESHIHIMWIIELWWIGNPSSFYLMQLWSERKKKQKKMWKARNTHRMKRTQLSDWLSERTNESEFFSLHTSSLLLHYRFEPNV